MSKLTFDDVLDVVMMKHSDFEMAWEGVIIEILNPVVGLPQTWEHFLLQP